jgi:uncharacterized membrane protein required for colicin V production
VHLIELAIGLPLLVLVLNGARRGFLREGSLLGGCILSVWLAGRLHQPIGGAILPAGGSTLWSVGLYFGLNLVLLLLAAGLSARLAPRLRAGPLVLLDHTAGLGIGLFEAVFVAGLLMLGVNRLGLSPLATGTIGIHITDFSLSGLTWLASSVRPEALGAAGAR